MATHQTHTRVQIHMYVNNIYMDVDKSKGHWKALFGSAFFRYIQFQAARLGTEYPQINNKIIVSQPRITNNWFDFF